jgi:hypothetical protein
MPLVVVFTRAACERVHNDGSRPLRKKKHFAHPWCGRELKTQKQV